MLFHYQIYRTIQMILQFFIYIININDILPDRRHFSKDVDQCYALMKSLHHERLYSRTKLSVYFEPLSNSRCIPGCRKTASIKC